MELHTSILRLSTDHTHVIKTMGANSHDEASWRNMDRLSSLGDFGGGLLATTIVPARASPVHGFNSKTRRPESWTRVYALAHWAGLLPGVPAEARPGGDISDQRAAKFSRGQKSLSNFVGHLEVALAPADVRAQRQQEEVRQDGGEGG